MQLSTDSLSAKFKVFCTKGARHILFYYSQRMAQKLLFRSQQVKIVSFLFVLQNPQFNV